MKCAFHQFSSLSKLQSELAAASQKERESVQALRDSEDILAKRRNEIARMRDQVRIVLFYFSVYDI